MVHVKVSNNSTHRKPLYLLRSAQFTLQALWIFHIPFQRPVLISEWLLWFSEDCEGGREQEKERDRSFIFSFSYSEAHLSVKERFQYVLHTWASTANNPDRQMHIFITLLQFMTLKYRIGSAGLCVCIAKGKVICTQNGSLPVTSFVFVIIAGQN